MLHKSRGIALSYIRYKETSIIAKVYTETFGMQSYIVNGVRSSRSRSNRIALFQPLTLLDMVVYRQPKADALHRLSEIQNRHPFREIPFHPIKTSLAIFVTEMLTRVLREEESNEALFDFLERSVLYLEDAREGYENFHLQFLLELAAYLGFGLESVGDFYGQLKEYPATALPSEDQLLHLQALLNRPYGTPLKITRQERGALLQRMLLFYKLHLPNLGEIRSLEVLQEVLK